MPRLARPVGKSRLQLPSAARGMRRGTCKSWRSTARRPIIPSRRIVRRQNTCRLCSCVCCRANVTAKRVIAIYRMTSRAGSLINFICVTGGPPMNAKELAKINIDMVQVISLRYLEDLTYQELMHRPAKGAKHINWQLGHLIQSENDMM